MNWKHGLTKTKEFKIWNSMKQRCYNPKNERFASYGGRGIKVCESWVNSFSEFLNDMGGKPANKSLDRINNDGNYEPSNCRWASPKEQQRNTRLNHVVIYEGNEVPLIEMAERFNLNYSTLSKRINRAGMSLEDALNPGRIITDNHKHMKKIIQMSKDGKVIKIHESVNHAASELKVDSSSLARAARGEYEFSKGYRWKYAA